MHRDEYMPTFKERMRLQDIAQAEADGADFWSAKLDNTVKRKIAYALHDAAAEMAKLANIYESEVWQAASRLIARENGLAMRRFDTEALAGEADPHIVLSFVEIFCTYAKDTIGVDQLRDLTNRIFDSHRVKFQLAPNLQIIPRDSQEIHAAVTLPTLQLLHGRSDLGEAESAYMEALREISDGKPAGAITHASVALQEALTTLGAPGNALGDQLKTAKAKTKLFTGRDQPLLDGISKVVDWVAAERNINGDAHRVTGAVLDDAWMMVHVVGALILRLAGEPRS